MKSKLKIRLCEEVQGDFWSLSPNVCNLAHSFSHRCSNYENYRFEETTVWICSIKNEGWHQTSSAVSMSNSNIHWMIYTVNHIIAVREWFKILKWMQAIKILRFIYFMKMNFRISHANQFDEIKIYKVAILVVEAMSALVEVFGMKCGEF